MRNQPLIVTLNNKTKNLRTFYNHSLTDCARMSKQLNYNVQSPHRTLEVVLHDFPRTFMSIFHVSPGQFYPLDIEVSFSYTFIK